MQTLDRLRPRHIPGYFLTAILLCLFGAASLRAQTLAQPNWAGSGVSDQPWWQRAVFYRIDLTKFQDSDGNGRGDLAGVTERLDYLQSLGVDALILDAGQKTSGQKTTISPDGFDDLARAAVGRHLRVLVELRAPASQSADAQYLQTARMWLNQGAAGLYLATPAIEQVDGADHIAQLLQQLRALTDSFPGGRVLIAAAPATPDEDLVAALARETQLTASAALGSASSNAMPTAAILRAQLTSALADAASASQQGSERHRGHAAADSGNNPLLVAVRVPEQKSEAAKMGLERALAAMLLASRSAVLLDYGQELGLDVAGAREPLMQWTPTNLTRAPKPEPKPAPKKTGSQYESYQAYVPPLRRDLFPPPPLPIVVESYENIVDPSTLPGFTAGTLDASLASPNGATANVGTEQNDLGSLLHLYRQLIQLHHENATLRNGTETLLDFDAEDALVWMRRAPATSRTSSNVIAACNLSNKPVDLGSIDLRGLRSLLNPWPAGDLTVVQPDAVLVGAVR